VKVDAAFLIDTVEGVGFGAKLVAGREGGREGGRKGGREEKFCFILLLL